MEIRSRRTDKGLRDLTPCPTAHRATWSPGEPGSTVRRQLNPTRLSLSECWAVASPGEVCAQSGSLPSLLPTSRSKAGTTRWTLTAVSQKVNV